MRHTLTLSERHERDLRSAVFSEPGLEGAAFVLCGESAPEGELRLLAREVIPVAPEHYISRLPDFLSLDSFSYARVAKRAREEGLSVLLAHSHPFGPREFSPQDDKEDVKLHEFLAARVPRRTHGSLVLTPDGVVGRVWRDGLVDMERVRVIGKRWRFHERSPSVPTPEWYDRQVRAFGPGLQAIFSRLRVGVVGAGGTGSAVVELLARLGVGKLLLFDDDLLSDSNVTRVLGSGRQDVGAPKVLVAARNVERIGLEAQAEAVQSSINEEATARRLRECDVIFGCTDKQRPRAALQELVTRYLIPVIDMGVVINAPDGIVQDVVGRVSVLSIGDACLFCRDHITPDGIRHELLPEEERRRLVREGYAPQLPDVEPAVVTFTAAVSAWAVSTFLERFVGYMPEGVRGSEMLLLFHHGKARGIGTVARPGCVCQDSANCGVGDEEPFLGQIWPESMGAGADSRQEGGKTL